MSDDSHSIEAKKKRKLERQRPRERMPSLDDLVESRSLEIFKTMHCVVDPFEMLKSLMKESANNQSEMD